MNKAKRPRYWNRGVLVLWKLLLIRQKPLVILPKAQQGTGLDLPQLRKVPAVLDPGIGADGRPAEGQVIFRADRVHLQFRERGYRRKMLEHFRNLPVPFPAVGQADVQLRVEKNLEAAEVPIEVSVRPIEPQGKLIGFASVNIGGIVIDDFKVVNGKNGIFLGEPSKPDPTTRTGYRSTARVTNRALQERLSAAAADGYNVAVEKLIARAEALRPKPIREQMANAAKEAAKENAARPAPAKGKEARDDR